MLCIAYRVLDVDVEVHDHDDVVDKEVVDHDADDTNVANDVDERTMLLIVLMISKRLSSLMLLLTLMNDANDDVQRVAAIIFCGAAWRKDDVDDNVDTDNDRGNVETNMFSVNILDDAQDDD